MRGKRLAFALVAALPSIGLGAKPEGGATNGALPPSCLALAGVAGFGLVLAFDDPLRSGVQDARGGLLGDLLGRDFGRGGLDHLGRGFGGTAVPAALYAGGWLTGSEAMRRSGVIGVQAYFAADLLSKGAKRLIGRRRPGYGDPFSFDPLGGPEGFPSGHAAGAFAVASAVAEEHESLWVDLLAYGTASAVAFARVYRDAHWTSDAVGGALLGTLVGKGVSRLERRWGWSRRLYVGGAGLYWVRRF